MQNRIYRKQPNRNAPCKTHKKGKVSGFKGIMKALNRKTIPCCRKCHRKIHSGQYDRTSLRKILDTDIITL